MILLLVEHERVDDRHADAAAMSRKNFRSTSLATADCVVPASTRGTACTSDMDSGEGRDLTTSATAAMPPRRKGAPKRSLLIAFAKR
jgi:hypothetical protein